MTKIIVNLAPRHPHKFRLQVILKASAINSLKDSAIKYYGDEKTAYSNITTVRTINDEEKLNGNENTTDDNQKSLFRENKERYGSEYVGNLTSR